MEIGAKERENLEREKMKKCELCRERARMFCEADQANLCWDCDMEVHCANFLVAKHSRTLLCHVCQSPTPWTASGRKLTPTVSVCEGCVEVHGEKCEQGGGDEGSRREIDEDPVDDNDGTDDSGDFEIGVGSDSEEDDVEDEEEEEDGENQVVPWSFASSSCSSPPPPPMASSSSDGEIFGEADAVSKRRREQAADLDSDDEMECSSGPQSITPLRNDEATSSSSARPFKRTRVSRPNQSLRIQDDECRAELKSTAVIRSIQRLQNRMPTDIDDASKMIFGICKMSRDQGR